jgi:hypothetical protein
LISADDHGRIAPDDVKARVPRALHEHFDDAIRLVGPSGTVSVRMSCIVSTASLR